MNKLVIASGNAGKLREIQALLAPLGCSVLTQAALGIAEAEEPHLTFIENALAKARHAAERASLPALADDSGVCVVALAASPACIRGAMPATRPAAKSATRATTTSW